MGARARGRSTKAVAAENAERVENWIASTPLRDVPPNQFGRAAVKTILEDILGIPRSTLKSNRAIALAFEALDARLLAHVKEHARSEAELPPTHDIAHIAVLHNELSRMSNALRHFEYLENTGRTPL